MRVGEEAKEQRRRDIYERKGDGVPEKDASDGFVDQEEEVDDANEEK